MDADVVRPAERRRVGESEGCATMLKMCDVVDFEETGPTAPFRLTTPTVTIARSRVPGSGVRGRGSGERETTASSLAGKQQAREKEDNGGQGKDGPAGAIAQGGNGR